MIKNYIQNHDERDDNFSIVGDGVAGRYLELRSRAALAVTQKGFERALARSETALP